MTSGHPGNYTTLTDVTNISKEQLKLALRMTCEVSGLTFGKDIKFPIR